MDKWMPYLVVIWSLLGAGGSIGPKGSGTPVETIISAPRQQKLEIIFRSLLGNRWIYGWMDGWMDGSMDGCR